MQIGDYIVKTGGETETPGKIVDEDVDLWVIEWGLTAIGVIAKTDTGYEVLAHGDPSRGWGNKQK